MYILPVHLLQYLCHPLLLIESGTHYHPNQMLHRYEEQEAL